MNSIQTLSSRIAYQNRWMTVREDAVRFDDGPDGIYGVVEKVDYSVVVPYCEERLYLVDQFRYAPQIRSLEFPQGSWETEAAADPADVALGELEEETGLQASNLKPLGYIHVAPGYSTQRAHVFLATSLKPGIQHLEPSETGLRTHEIALGDICELLDSRVITDSATISALLLAARHVPTLAHQLLP